MSNAEASGEFSLRSVAMAAYVPSALYGLSQGAMLPVIALSAIDRGANTAVAALISALLGIGSIVTNIPSGILAARLGERKAMLIASAVTSIGLALCLLRTGSGAGGLLLYGFAIFLLGSASSVFILARQAYLTEAVPPYMRARALSTLGGTGRVGVFVGPFLSAGATHLWGLDGAYYVSLAATAVASVIIVRIPDLEVSNQHREAAADVTTRMIIEGYRRVFLTLGFGILLLSAVRQTRQVVIPLWATHIGLSPSASSMIYGVAGGIDALMFYPAGRVMDRRGRRWVGVPSVVIIGSSFFMMTFTHGVWTLALAAVVMGFGNGIGSGVVMTLGADTSPAIGRHAFLGVWRELADAGAGMGPLILSGMTALAGLTAGFFVSGAVGFVAAAALWKWIPRHVVLDQRDKRRRPTRSTVSGVSTKT